MNINNFFEKRISVRSILIMMTFFLIIAAIFLYFAFGGIKEGFQAGLVGIGSVIDYKMGNGVKKSWENKERLEKHLRFFDRHRLENGSMDWHTEEFREKISKANGLLHNAEKKCDSLEIDTKLADTPDRVVNWLLAPSTP